MSSHVLLVLSCKTREVVYLHLNFARLLLENKLRQIFTEQEFIVNMIYLFYFNRESWSYHEKYY